MCWAPSRSIRQWMCAVWKVVEPLMKLQQLHGHCQAQICRIIILHLSNLAEFSNIWAGYSNWACLHPCPAPVGGGCSTARLNSQKSDLRVCQIWDVHFFNITELNSGFNPQQKACAWPHTAKLSTEKKKTLKKHVLKINTPKKKVYCSRGC
jgi:hypothetical protein